jgi:type II secretory pathway component PulJ
MKNALKLLNRPQATSGFTLIELLLASSLTLIVVGAAGLGVATMINSDRTSSATNQVQSNLNRAIEFMSGEITPSQKMETDVSATALQNNAPTFYTAYSSQITSGKITPILAIKAYGIPERIIYYTKNKAMETSSDSTPWLGPLILYRWGPNFDSNGQYSGTTKISPSLWQAEALVDLVDNGTVSASCPSNWFLNPDPNPSLPDTTAKNVTKGLYTCVRNDGRFAKLYSNATSGTLSNGQTATYSVNTQIFARTDTTSATGLNFPSFKINNGVLSLESGNGNVTFRVIAYGLTCPTMNATIFVDPDTTADITLTSAGSSQSQAISSSDQIRIQANASGGSCSSASVDSTSTTAGAVTLVQDGTPLSAIASSSSAQTNLTNLLGSSYVQNGTIKLSENQVLYFLETNTADSDFPADDAIVLVTINP